MGAGQQEMEDVVAEQSERQLLHPHAGRGKVGEAGVVGDGWVDGWMDN